MGRTHILFGRNILEEALSLKLDVSEIYVENDGAEKFAKDLLRTRNLRIPVQRHIPKPLREASHQGVAFRVDHDFYLAKERVDPQEFPRVLLCNHLEDVQNLGAIVRSAAAFGFNLIVHEDRRSVSVSPAVVRVSAGCAFRVKFLSVPNLLPYLKTLEKEGYLTAGLAKGEGSRSLYDFTVSLPLALVVGSESDGISKPVVSQLNEQLWIPMSGGVESLNAAQAATLAMGWIYHRSEDQD